MNMKRFSEALLKVMFIKTVVIISIVILIWYILKK